jgi:hypothetical protein
MFAVSPGAACAAEGSTASPAAASATVTDPRVSTLLRDAM